jgi:peptidoglycan/LPS O-acetylase OafA/YrhL
MGDVIAHLLMLQDVLGIPALSAGVWYLAIDLQLFAGTVLLLVVARWAAQRSSHAAMQYLGVALVLALTAASLFWFNRQRSLDHLGIYFYGSYGLGLLTYWALHLPQVQARKFLRVAVPGLLVAALWVDFRSRLVLAGVTALVLWAGVAFAPVQRTACAPMLEPLRHLGRMSYSVFLIHYPVLLVFNAVLGLWWPHSQVANVLGMLGVLVCSVGAASLIYRQVERSPLSHVRAAALLAPLLMVTVAMA